MPIPSYSGCLISIRKANRLTKKHQISPQIPKHGKPKGQKAKTNWNTSSGLSKLRVAAWRHQWGISTIPSFKEESRVFLVRNISKPLTDCLLKTTGSCRQLWDQILPRAWRKVVHLPMMHVLRGCTRRLSAVPHFVHKAVHLLCTALVPTSDYTRRL